MNLLRGSQSCNRPTLKAGRTSAPFSPRHLRQHKGETQTITTPSPAGLRPGNRNSGGVHPQPPGTFLPSAIASDHQSAGSTSAGTKTIRVHYIRRDKKYQDWGLHIWGDVVQPTDWQRPLDPQGYEAATGIWWDINVKPGAHHLGLLVHVGETKSARAEISVSDLGHGHEVWLMGDEQRAHMGGGAPDISSLPAGTLNKQSAVWVSRDIIAWRHGIRDTDGPRSFKLHMHPKGYMWINNDGVQGAEASFDLAPVAPKLSDDLAKKWPYLAGCAMLRVPEAVLKDVWSLFRSQLAVSVSSGGAHPTVLDCTGLQLQGGLDAHATYDGPLGVIPDKATGKISVAVWAPTAQSVQLLHYPGGAQGGPEHVLPMQCGAMGPGVWSAELPDGAMWTYYKYRVTVYCPWTNRMEVSDATDPYSRSLAADGERTQVVPPDLDDPSLAPEGWHDHAIPSISRWTDISVYELHIRDFSSADASVKPEVQGKYLAFVPEKAAAAPGKLTAGLSHLAELKKAGMNHLHLLPTYDFGSVPERPEHQAVVKEDLSQHAPDSEAQQAAVLAVADHDAFNWGYDPVHWGVPEGSYATNPDGAPRIREFREMVMALHKQGWRVVLDVVYNHVYAAGPSSKHSVLDKIVPGYYQRRMEDGEMCHSTCCNNTATEYAMCERLVVDDIVHWAQHYKIDGFRFDIMGHLLVRTLAKMRAGLDALTPQKHGVDGSSIYIYGEAWDFGEVVNNARGVNCGQINLAGTNLGCFNDRLRDGALGGGPFAPYEFQGFVTGLALAPNGTSTQGSCEEQSAELAVLTDWVRYSLAGNLRSYAMETASGRVLRGDVALAHGQPLAYGAQPCEHVAFIGCHDNLTMFDFITEKAPLTAVAEERVRMQVLCLALITFSQGIPFIHAGDDLLRSKSLDRDSYNSGDWFNSVDWTGNTHKLGIGLPVHTKNGGGWHYKRPLLSNCMIKPTPEQLHNTAAITRQLLAIRYSSPLFRLPSAAAIAEQLRFHNTGPQQILGVIVMELVSSAAGAASAATGKSASSAAGSKADGEVPPTPVYDSSWFAPRPVDGTQDGLVHDPNYERIVVVFNAAPLEQEVPYPASAGHLQLHPLQAAKDAPDARAAACTADNGARVLRVQPRTTAVFVQRR